ncbi:diacylglycerol kinase [Thalassoroseus pseudoceratinae]|uniref:diacylglycerol kinase n=1 Tax=Thalassoroseus pseudoceratinae TaxID=2713176 RepID=UPI00141F0D9E|nr:diacylglycerol kinase [Thalassoroseus pseudoceratinae]
MSQPQLRLQTFADPSAETKPVEPPNPTELDAEETLCRAERRRPMWRRRLVDAERGLTEGFRGDSTFFVYFFGGTVVLAAGWVLGITLVQWCFLVFSLTTVIGAELFHRALMQTLESLPEAARPTSPTVRKLRRISAAGVTMITLGTLLAIGLIIGHKLWQTFTG